MNTLEEKIQKLFQELQHKILDWRSERKMTSDETIQHRH